MSDCCSPQAYGRIFSERSAWKRARRYRVWEPEGLLASLARLGIRPEEVDLVVTTHLHWDHAGGLTRRAPLDGEGGRVTPFSDRPDSAPSGVWVVNRVPSY